MSLSKQTETYVPMTVACRSSRNAGRIFSPYARSLAMVAASVERSSRLFWGSAVGPMMMLPYLQ